MGLVFIVGNPDDALTESFAESIRRRIAEQFGGKVALDGEEPEYVSDEVGWSGWALLQERVASAIGAERARHLMSMPAWCGCYLPVEISPATWRFDGQSSEISVGSLFALVRELEAFGAELGLPVDDASIKTLAERYCDDENVDDDMDLQTYAQLLPAAHVAQRRRQILWVVK